MKHSLTLLAALLLATPPSIFATETGKPQRGPVAVRAPLVELQHTTTKAAQLWPDVGIRAGDGTLLGMEPALARKEGPVLKWTASAGQQIEVTPAALAGASGIDVSICYEEQHPDMVKLAILGTDDAEICHFELHPDGWGWRRLYAEFATDATTSTGQSRQRPARMVLSWKGAGRRTLYLAQPQWLKAVTFRRTPDVYCASIYAKRTDSYAAGMREWLGAGTNRPPARVPLCANKADLVYRHYLEWVLGNDGNPGVFGKAIAHAQSDWIAKAHQELRRVGLHREGPWVVAARGQYPTQDNLKDLLTPLAMAYRRAPNDALLQDLFLIFDALHQSGFAVCNPADPAADYMGFSRLRLAGYANGIGLLREELIRAGRMERERRTLRWHSRAGEWDGSERFEANADSFRGEALPRLIYALTAPDENWRARELSCFQTWLAENLAVQANLQGLIKPDMTLNHHHNPYLVEYGPQGLLAAGNCAWILERSAWSLDRASKDRLEACAETLLILSRGFTLPLGARGRFPDGERVMTDNLALLITLSKNDVFSGRLAGAAHRLIEAVGTQKAADSLGQQSVKQRLGWKCSAGIAKMADAVLMAPLDAAERHGFFSFNWAGFATARRPGWQATVQGFSKWLYDYETGNFPQMDNDWGRYLRYGTLELWSGPDPFDEPSAGLTLRQGWDWSLMPGATTLRLSSKDLGLPAPPGKRAHRNFSDRAFCASLAGPGDFGAFGLDLHDLTFEGKLEARKSVIFAGDLIICLGSRIRANREHTSVVTTLFQFGKGTAVVPERDDAGPISADAPMMLSDLAGNQFRLLAGGRWQRHAGKQSGPNTKGKITTGFFDTAWIDHGVLPKDQGYLYEIEPKVRGRAAVLPVHRILARNEAMHVVNFPAVAATVHVLFEPLAAPIGDLVSCNRPCLVWTSALSGARGELTICDPDLNCPGGLDNERDRESKPTEIQLELQGRYEVTSPSVANVQVFDHSTKCMVRCVGGAPVKMTLKTLSRQP